jgi:hypothetical protein
MGESERPDWDELVCVSPNQVSSRIGEDVTVLGLDKGTYYGLNATGARIWELLQQPIRVADIHAALVDEFDVDAETARGDLLAVLADLRAAGLVEVRGESAPSPRGPSG